MTNDEFTQHPREMLAELEVSRRVSLAEWANCRRVRRKQNQQLAIGRLKIDATRAALEARLQSNHVGDA